MVLGMQKQTVMNKYMADTITTEIQTDIELSKKALTLLKAKDYAGLAVLGEQNFGLIKQQAAEVSNLIPAVKAGWKTSEFWLISVFVAINVYCVAKGITLPMTDDISVAGLIATYSVNRHLTKTASTPTVTSTVITK